METGEEGVLGVASHPRYLVTCLVTCLGMTSNKKTDYLVTLIKRVGRYHAEITIS